MYFLLIFKTAIIIFSMNIKELKYIRYTFIDNYLKGICESRYDTEWTIYPDGRILRRTIEKKPGIDEETFMSDPGAVIGPTKRFVVEKETLSIEPSEVQNLLDRLQSELGEFNRMCDAMDRAKIVFSHNQTIEFDPAPLTLYSFFFKLSQSEQ